MANLDDDAWNCPKHTSRRPRIGVCPICLHERLSSLCPDCAHALPCACIALSASSSYSSSSSSFSLVSHSVSDFPIGTGSVGRVASLISSEPAFRKSRSVAVPYDESDDPDPDSCRRIHRSRGNSFWRLFRSKRGEDREIEEKQRKEMRKSRSVAAGDYPEKTAARGISWYFPSPMKAFRQSRVSRMVFHLRSPLYRG